MECDVILTKKASDKIRLDLNRAWCATLPTGRTRGKRNGKPVKCLAPYIHKKVSQSLTKFQGLTKSHKSITMSQSLIKVSQCISKSQSLTRSHKVSWATQKKASLMLVSWDFPIYVLSEVVVWELRVHHSGSKQLRFPLTLNICPHFSRKWSEYTNWCDTQPLWGLCWIDGEQGPIGERRRQEAEWREDGR